MLGERSYSEGNATLLHHKPPFVTPMNEKKKKASIRNKINSVKSFFSDRNKFRQGSLSRNASMPDIYAAMGNGDHTTPENLRNNNKSNVKLRNKSSRHGGKLSLRPRSECLEFINEDEGLTPTMPWMRRHMMQDYSPASTISTRSDYSYRSPLMFDEREEFMSASQTNLATPLPSLIKMADSFDSLLSDGGISSLDENHNNAPLFPKFPTDNRKMTKSKDRHDKNQRDTNSPVVDKSNGNGLDNGLTDNLQRNLYVRKSKSFQHQKTKGLFPAERTKHYSAEAEDITRNRGKNLPSLEYKDLQTLMEVEATRVLDGRGYDPKTAAKWSKEISGSIRERLRHHTSRNYKIVVNTFIGTVGMSQENVHVACQSVTDPTTDRFIMIALKTDEFFVAITLLLLKY